MVTIVICAAVSFVIGMFVGVAICSNQTTPTEPSLKDSIQSRLGEKGCELVIFDDSYYPGECPDPMDVVNRYGGAVRQIRTGNILYKTPYYGSPDEVYKKVNYVMPSICDIIAKNS